MIELSNGYKLDFLAASGALGFDGQGYLWEQPFRWLGLLNTDDFTVITKTLTLEPVIGNLTWRFWHSIHFIQNGVCNAVGLANPGLDWWIGKRHNKKVIVSIMPRSVKEAIVMARKLNPLDVIGIEFNASCPNTEPLERICETTMALVKNSRHPVIVKLGWHDDYIRVCRDLDGEVAAFDLINSVPWPLVFPKIESPLARYGLTGGVSGHVIRKFAREALWKAKIISCRTPIISGGGIDSVEEVVYRHDIGAGAFSFGTQFLRTPWLPNKIARTCRLMWKEKRLKG